MWQPEPGWMALPGGSSASTVGVWRTVLGDQDHAVGDGGNARMIRHGLVTPGAGAEHHVVRHHCRRTLCRRKLRPARLIADATDATGETMRAVAEQGVRASRP